MPVGPSKLLAWMDWFAPGQDGDGRRRARLLATVCFGLVLTAGPLMARLYVVEDHLSTTQMAFLLGAVIMSVNPFLARRTGRHRQVALLACAELYAVLLVQTYANGGLESAALPWMLVVPVLAAFLVGPRAAVGFGVLVALTPIGLFIGASEGVTYPRPLDDQEMVWWAMAGTAFLAVFLTGLSLVWEASRVEALADADEARRLAESASEAKSLVLANLSHEVRTPLNGIVGLTRMLGETEPSPAQRSMLDELSTSATRLWHLLDVLMDFSSLEEGEMSIASDPFDPRLLVDDVVSRLAKAARERSVEVRSEVEESVPKTLMSDAGRIRGMLYQLLDNAIKFTEHGQVDVRVGHEADTLVIEVCDTGVGMDDPKHLMQPFTQADPSATRAQQGLGMGLAIVRRSIDLLSGELNIDSQPGHGTRVVLRIPADAIEEKEPVPLAVLLAEDSPINQQILELMLEGLGHQPTVVANGLEAVQATETSRYDVVLMDVQMPVMDGLEAARKIQQQSSPPPVIAVTANVTEQDRRNCREAGMVGFIAKPIRSEALAAMLAPYG